MATEVRILRRITNKTLMNGGSYINVQQAYGSDVNSDRILSDGRTGTATEIE